MFNLKPVNNRITYQVCEVLRILNEVEKCLIVLGLRFFIKSFRSALGHYGQIIFGQLFIIMVSFDP